jgi:lipopolysaccharide export system permease protein
LGMWMASIVLFPIGIFLTYKAMRDSKLLSNETYARLLRSFPIRFQFSKKTAQSHV